VVAKREPLRRTFCHDCGQELHDPPLSGIIPVSRESCPNCESTAREYQVRGSVGAGTADEVVSAAPAPGVVIENEVGTFTREVRWSKTPDCWLAEIRDLNGNLVGVELAFDAQDAFLLLDEHIVSPES